VLLNLVKPSRVCCYDRHHYIWLSESYLFCSMLDPSKIQLYDFYKQLYADILYQWGYFVERAQLLKTKSQEPRCFGDYPVVLQCKYTCYGCKQPYSGARCPSCLRVPLTCSICRSPVRGASIVCLLCSHGGHTDHMGQWFAAETVCPTGCGCNCLEYNTADT